MTADVLKAAQDAFTKAQDAAEQNHARALEDLRFARLGDQWPEAIRKMRENDKRPCLTINKMPTFIKQVVNDARQNKPQIKTHPVDSKADPETSEVLNGLIRNIEVQSNADAAYDTAIEHAVSMGFGYFRVNIEYAYDDTFDKDICIERITNPLTVFEDPNAEAVDGSDWKYCFVTEMMPIDEFKAKYPKAEAIDFDGAMDDDIRSKWFEEEKVRVAEWWQRQEVDDEVIRFSNGETHRASDLAQEVEAGVTRADMLASEGAMEEARRPTKTWKVTQTILNGQEVLSEIDWPGRWIPIIPVYGDEVIEEGKRHFLSLIHFAKDPQRMLNYWRSTTTELVALAPKAPWVGPVGSFVTDEGWATANTNSAATLEYDPVVSDEGVPMPPPQRQGFAGVPAGALQEAMSANDDIMSTTGLFQASLGEKSNEKSGKAILARQREGDTSTFHFIDNMSRAIRYAGRVIVDLIPHVYSEARVIRVLGEDGKPENVKINQKSPEMMQGMPQQGIPQQMPQGNPMEVEEGARIFDLTVGKYDVTVKSGPSYTTQRQESADQMLNLIQSFPQAAPVLGDLLAKNLDWPQADEIEKRLKALLPPQVQEEDPRVAQMNQAIKQLTAQLEAVKTDKSLDAAKVQNETREVEIKAFEAETDRMKVMAELQQPMTPLGAFPGQ